MSVVTLSCIVIAIASMKAHISFASVIGNKTVLTTHLLGMNGLEIPRIGFGTAGLGILTQEAVQVALDIGYDMVDTAQAQEWYSEESVSKAMGDSGRSREDVFVVTKVHPRSFSFKRLEKDLKQSHSLLCQNCSLRSSPGGTGKSGCMLAIASRANSKAYCRASAGVSAKFASCRCSGDHTSSMLSIVLASMCLEN